MASGYDSSTVYKDALKQNHLSLVEEIHADDLMDAFIQEGLLPDQAIREIKALGSPVEKNRMIVDRVSRSGHKGYEKFKRCLRISHHGHLVEQLEEKEKILLDSRSRPLTRQSFINNEKDCSKKMSPECSTKVKESPKCSTKVKESPKCSTKVKESPGPGKSKSKNQGACFNISGLGIRGYFKTKKEWVPKQGQKCDLEQTEDGSIAVKVKDKDTKKIIIAGRVATEVSGIVRMSWRLGMTCKAKVSSDKPEDKGKGEQIKCVYMFSGQETPRLINHAREMEQKVIEDNKKNGSKMKFNYVKGK